MTGYRPVWVSKKYQGKILACGSVIGSVRPHDVIVGAGLIRDEAFTLPPNVTVVALRGPLTADLLKVETQDVLFGDPGLLAPEIMGISRDDRAERISVVPHQVDFAAVRSYLANSPVNSDAILVNVEETPAKVVGDIARSRACVSTSLHGLIIAEALGIPAIWATMHGPLEGGTFKFRDYYLSTARTQDSPLEMAEALEIAKDVEGHGFQPDTSSLKVAFATLLSLTMAGKPRSEPNPGLI